MENQPVVEQQPQVYNEPVRPQLQRMPTMNPIVHQSHDNVPESNVKYNLAIGIGITALIITVVYVIVNTIQLYQGSGPYSKYLQLGKMENYLSKLLEEGYNKKDAIRLAYLEFVKTHPTAEQ